MVIPIFKSVTPNMMVSDVNETVAYYADCLGFDFNLGVTDHMETIKKNPTGLPLIWAMVTRGDTSLMVQNASSLAQDLPDFKELKPGGTFTLYFSVTDVATLYDEFKDKANIFKAPYKTVYGADEFVVRDINGYYLYFSEQHRTIHEPGD
jgi:uncharacterized glyoxalase superfamily protein PhnB